MAIADTSIKNPVFAWMLMASLVVFGTIGFLRMGVSQMPDIDFPVVTVNVTLEGASPEIMETDVVDVIEDSVMSIEGIRQVTASTYQGSATVTIEFDLSRSIDAAVQDVQTKLAQAQRLLPREIDPPVVTKTNPEDQPILWLALSGNVPLPQLMMTARYNIKDSLQTVNGVGEVFLGGYLDRNLRVWLKLDEMESRQLTVDDIVTALQREHVEVPAGRIETSEREMNVRAMGEAPTIQEFENIVVAYRNDAPVLLKQVAVIEDGLADLRRISRSNGLPAVGLGVKKQRGANAVEVAHGVKQKLNEIQKNLPKGRDGEPLLNLTVNFDSTKFIEDSIREIQFTLVLSVMLTSLVCLLFLGSWTSTFNILLSIPTSIMGSFIILYFLGFTLNTFTLMALSLAVGIVVDDAIMVLENIVRHAEKGEKRVTAASKGAKEITMAALAATAALMAIFLPIAFMQGIIGKFLYQFGVTMSVAVALSLLEALTLTPMRCSQWLSVGERASAFGRVLDRFFKGLASGYRRVLEPSLRWRWAVLVLSTVGFMASMYFATRLRQEVVPSQDQSMFLVRALTPVGSSLTYTDERMRKCEEFMAAHPEFVDRYYVAVGGFGGGDVTAGMMFVTLKQPGHRGPGNPTQTQIMGMARSEFNKIPGLSAFPIDLSLRGFTGQSSQFPIEVAVSGPDWQKLADESEKIMEKMKNSGLMTDVNTDYLVGMPEVEIIPKRKRAADIGVSMISIGNTVNALIGGLRASKFSDQGHRFDVRVRLISDQRSRPDDVRKLFVRSRDGKLVRMSEVVDVSQKPAVQTITRRNRSRSITLRANMAAGKSQKDAMESIQAAAADLPSGYRIEFTGSSQLFQDAKLSFLFALGIGVLIAYMVLAAQFNSYVHPTLILLAMPFSLTGAVLALLISGVSLNMYSMIGLILLMGIVKKNSILLVEFTSQMRERGLEVREALLTACPVRLRPILMTSVATIAAALPAALAIGPGAETRIPMAIVIIGGLALSTLLTLFVVPCAYAIVPGRVRHSAEVAAAIDEPSSSAEPGAAPGPVHPA